MTPRWSRALAVAAALAASGALAAAPAAKPASKAAARDWTRTVSATPDGGFLMGNPNAPVKVIEYGSFTCNHCANFAREGMPALVRDYVKTGRASLEYRSFVRDPYDVTAALVARCAPPARFFGLSDRIFAGQEGWVKRILALSQDEMKALHALPVPDRVARIAGAAGLDAMAAQAGVPPAKLKQCLSDEKGMERLAAMREVAVEKHGVQATPSFIVNGKLTDAHSWSALQPLLGPPGG